MPYKLCLALGWACVPKESKSIKITAGLRLFFYRRGRAFTENLSILIFNFRVFSTQLRNAQTSKFPKTSRMCHKKFET